MPHFGGTPTPHPVRRPNRAPPGAGVLVYGTLLSVALIVGLFLLARGAAALGAAIVGALGG
jgi:hypothetical protein